MKNKGIDKNAENFDTVHTRDLLTDKKIEDKKASKIQDRENKQDNKSFGAVKMFLYKIKTGTEEQKKTIKRKNTRKSKNGEPIVIDFNLSLTIIKTILMIAIISIILAQLTLTIIKANKQQDLVANQENEEKVKWVASKQIDENREEVLDENKDPIDDTRTVPVPGGYTASQVPGERSIDTGFVIYEGDINWADYISKDDLYNPDAKAEAQIKLKNPIEETNNYQWILLDNGTYVSGYKDENGNKYGNYNIDNTENKLKSNQFTLVQTETLIIKWAVSSEIEDRLYYTIKNTETGEITGGEEIAISGTTAGTNINELTYIDTKVELGKGTYEIEFTYSKNGSNSEGIDAGFVKSIEKKQPEYEPPEVVFTIPEGNGNTAGNYHWLQYEDGTYVSGYSGHGNYNVNTSTNTLTSEEFTIDRQVLLRFDWSVSSESVSYDYVYYTITDKTTNKAISGTGESATKIGGTTRGKNYASLKFDSPSVKLSAGTYTISFTYRKDGSSHSGLDAGFVKNVRLEQDTSVNIEYSKGTYQGGEYEEGVWSTGYVKEEKVYGNYHINKSESKLETEEITLTGSTTLKFEWTVSSQANDYLYYKITNTDTNAVTGGEPTKISGTTRGTEYSGLTYEEKTIYLDPGTYKIEYIYVKDNSGSEGLDAGFVKNIRTSLNYTQTELNIFNLQKSTNQYVWVPISEYELEEIYGVDRNGKLWGKLYENDYNPTTTHSTSGLNWTILDDGTMSITNPIGYREPDVTRYVTTGIYDTDRYDMDSQLPKEIKGKTRYELLSRELEQGYYETIESIKKYGGFYIGRYETGNSGVVQKMRKDSTTTWYSLYRNCKLLSGENNNVKTAMISGSLWDATLRWYIASGEKASNGEKIDNNYITNEYYATNLGNYYYSKFKYIEDGAPRGPVYDQEKKDLGKYVATGSTEHTKINNIYDMGGNMQEWTIETNDCSCRVLRGNSYGRQWHAKLPYHQLST